MEAGEACSQRRWRGGGSEERLEPEPVEGQYGIDETETAEQIPESRLARERERAARPERAKRRHGLEHIAERARVDDKDRVMRAAHRRTLHAAVWQAPSPIALGARPSCSTHARGLDDLGCVLLGVFAYSPGEELDGHSTERGMATLARPVGVG
jgi:hypothetical protein